MKLSDADELKLVGSDDKVRDERRLAEVGAARALAPAE